METTVNERIKELISFLKLKDREFAKAIGVPQTTLSNYLKRGSEPSVTVLVSILNSFEYINIYWLVLGIGEMIDKKDTQNEVPVNESILMKTVIELSGENAILKERVRTLEENKNTFGMAAEPRVKYSK